MEPLVTETFLFPDTLNGQNVYVCRLRLPPKSVEIFCNKVLPHFQKEISEGECKLLEDGRTYYRFKVTYEFAQQLRLIVLGAF